MEAFSTKTKWGLFRRRRYIDVDANGITMKRKSFIWFGPWEKITVPYDKMIFFGDNDDPNSAKALYVVEDGRYDELPTSSNLAAADDQDDWLMDSIKDDDDALLDYDEDEPLDEDCDADLYMYTATTKLPLTSEDMKRLHAVLESTPAVKAKVRKSSGFWCFSQYLAYTDKWLFHVNRKEVDSTPLSEMAFFIKNPGSIYCGYHRQVNAKVNSKALIQEIKDLCYSKARRLKEEGKTYEFGWFFPDKITLTDNAFIYTRKTLFKDEMAYVPYKRINMVLSQRKWLFWKKMNVFGEQDICPKHLMGASRAKEIENVLKEHGVKPDNGIPFNSAKIFPNNWFGRAPRVVCMDDCIVFYPNRIGGKKLKSCMMKYSDITHVGYFKKWFALFGTVTIVGVTLNIRQDQDHTSVMMAIPSIFAFKYKWTIFKGKLQKILRAKAPNADFFRERESIDLNDVDLSDYK
jgi:hypothetical protein